MEWVPSLVTGSLTLTGVFIGLVATRKREFNNWWRSEKVDAYVQIARFFNTVKDIDDSDPGQLRLYARNLDDVAAKAAIVCPEEVRDAIVEMTDEALGFAISLEQGTHTGVNWHKQAATSRRQTVEAMRKDLGTDKGLSLRAKFSTFRWSRGK